MPAYATVCNADDVCGLVNKRGIRLMDQIKQTWSCLMLRLRAVLHCVSTTKQSRQDTDRRGVTGRDSTKSRPVYSAVPLILAQST